MICPACDAERLDLSKLETIAFGVALCSATSGMHGVTEIMCEKHRPAYMTAMLTVTMKFQEPR